jgi:hypothetical protein
MRRLAMLPGLVLLSGLLAVGCDESGGPTEPEDLLLFFPQFHTASDPLVAELVAGGGNRKGATTVGEVHVWNDADYLYVKYVVYAGWCISETHMHVADHLEGIPQRNGNPPPGRFDYGDEHHRCLTEPFQYEVPLASFAWPVGTQLYIGAHAVVRSRRRQETAWGASGDCEFPGKNWATCITYELQGEEMEVEWPEGGRTTVAFEDEPADATDWDYNDWVADIDVLAKYFGTASDMDLVSMEFTVIPQAKIAGYIHVMHLGEDIFECDGEYQLYHDGSLVESGDYYGQLGIDVVLVPNTGSANTAQLFINFEGPCAFDFDAYDPYTTFHGEGLFFDPYLYVTNTDDEVHQGDVRMLTVPADWQWVEDDGTPIWEVYLKVGEAVDESGPVFTPYWWMP